MAGWGLGFEPGQRIDGQGNDPGVDFQPAMIRGFIAVAFIPQDGVDLRLVGKGSPVKDHVVDHHLARRDGVGQIAGIPKRACGAVSLAMQQAGKGLMRHRGHGEGGGEVVNFQCRVSFLAARESLRMPA